MRRERVCGIYRPLSRLTHSPVTALTVHSGGIEIWIVAALCPKAAADMNWYSRVCVSTQGRGNDVPVGSRQ